MFTDFIIDDPIVRDQYCILAYVFIGFGWQVAIMLTEHVEKIPKRPFSIFSLIVIVIIIITVITMNRSLVNVAVMVGIPLGIAFLGYYSYRLYHLADRSQAVRKQIISFFLSVLLIIVGYFCISDFLTGIYGIGLRICGDVLVIVGIHFFIWSLNHLPDFSEFDWIHSIRCIVIMHSNGISLFSRFWNSKESIDDTNLADKDTLISAAISSIDALLNEMVGKERLNRIQLQDNVVIFEKRQNFMTFVIASNYLESLAIRVREFSHKFESLYGSILCTWGGDVSVFLPVEALADIHFIARK